ncbi:MAG: diguanylate cyclase [Sphingomonadales bacterium]|nr:diguanylate cyclase [Sphingomonadales bacterium]
MAMALIACLLGGGGAVQARDNGLQPACYGSGFDDPATPESGWRCDGAHAPVGEGWTYARFDLAQDAEDLPRLMVSRLGRFDRLTLTVVDEDGAWRSRTVTPGDVEATAQGPFFKVELPEVTAHSQYLVAGFDRLNHRATAENAGLFVSDPARAPLRQAELIQIAIILGMLLMPIAFNAAFYRVLREDFIVWHSAMLAAFAMLVGVRSGLINLFYPLDMLTWRATLIWGMGLASASAVVFIRKVIEPGFLAPTTCRLLKIAPFWALGITAIHSADLEILQPLGGDFHALGMLPILLVSVWALGSSFWRGSRAARYQVIGWTPLLLTFTVQLVTQLVPWFRPVEWLQLFYLGILCEAIATALGVADRFLDLKRQRDDARVEARYAETLAERDPLTGLMNRRVLEPRFRQLRAEGFCTLAVLDLDLFKRINDVHGHGKGDEVLRATAEALAPDEDVLAVRMGGEEFAMLLRGDHVAERAEMRRVAITRHVAQRVPGLDRMVTASMGMVQLTEGLDACEFEDIYQRADRLLYEAKATGRNRTMCERLREFPPRPLERRDGSDRRKMARA